MTLQLGQYDLVGVIRAELLQVLADSPKHHTKDHLVEQRLDEMFCHWDWTQSFARRQILIYDEVLPSELLPMLHKWLRRKCADITNICLILTHHAGTKSWWQEWRKVNQVESFEICEIGFLSRPTATPSLLPLLNSDTEFNKNKSFFQENKKISKIFSYYGGSYTSREREYLFLKIYQFRQQAMIDFLGTLTTKNEILAYVENITYFKNQREVDGVAAAYDSFLFSEPNRYNDSTLARKKNEYVNFSDFQWQVDRQCFASVVRETINDNQYACITEKTIRAFLHHCVVIPIGYRSVEELEKKGFWFPHDIIDFGYQFQPLFADRIHHLMEMLGELVLQPLTKLQQYYAQNIDRFEHNAQLIYHDIKTQRPLEQILGDC